MQKRHQVFVSSTFRDLIDERNEVIKALLELDCIPCGMEYFPAANESQWQYIKSLIDQCDYYVVIVAGRYGSLTEDGVSYTQREYEYALEQEIPTIGFLHRSPEDIRAGNVESDSKAREKLQRFREQVQKRLCKEWSSAEELGAVVSRSLTQLIRRHPRVGWVRADSVDNLTSASEVLRLRKRIEELEEQLRAAIGSRAADADDLAQDEERIEFTTSCSFLDPSQPWGSPERKAVWPTHDAEATWSDIFKAVLPTVQIPVPETTVRAALNSMVRSFLLVQFNRGDLVPPQGYELTGVNVGRDLLNVVKTQMSALGFVAFRHEQTKSGTKCFWQITELGTKKLHQLLAVRKL